MKSCPYCTNIIANFDSSQSLSIVFTHKEFYFTWYSKIQFHIILSFSIYIKIKFDIYHSTIVSEFKTILFRVYSAFHFLCILISSWNVLIRISNIDIVVSDFDRILLICFRIIIQLLTLIHSRISDISLCLSIHPILNL